MTIGSGIFVLIDVMASHSHQLMWLSVLAAGVVSLMTSFSYGELAGMFQNNMGEADYIRSVTNDLWANVSGICILISDIFILATISLGLGHYLSVPTQISPVISAIISVIVLNYLNYRGLRLSANISQCALFLKLGAILLIIICGLINHHPQESLLSTNNVTASSFSAASIIGLFAYIGFNNMTNFTEETQKPEVTMGRAITTTVASVTVIYTLLAISALCIMTTIQLSRSTTPMATIFGQLFGSYGYVFLIGLAIISLLDTLLVSSVSESRYMHSFLSKLSPWYGQQDMDPQTRTPYWTIILLTFLTVVVIILFQQIGTIAVFGDLLILAIFVVVNIVTIILRIRHPETPRPFKVPFNIGRIPIPSVIGALLGIYGIYHYVI